MDMTQQLQVWDQGMCEEQHQGIPGGHILELKHGNV